MDLAPYGDRWSWFERKGRFSLVLASLVPGKIRCVKGEYKENRGKCITSGSYSRDMMIERSTEFGNSYSLRLVAHT